MKRSFVDTLSLGALSGLIAGAIFLAIALLAGAVSTTVWAMPEGIAHTTGLAAPAGYGFAPVPVVLGIVMHLALSVVLGIIFVALVRLLRLRGWVVVLAGVIFVTIETPVALWGVMHNVLPAATFTFFLAAIPLWGSLLGHYVYALVLGLLVARKFPAVRRPQQASTQLAAEK
jgi:hypothetical protein